MEVRSGLATHQLPWFPGAADGIFTRMSTDPIPPTFEQQVTNFFRSAASQAMENVPELRSIAIVFDWQDKLNDAAVPYIWTNRDKQITSGDLVAILGMMEQAQKLAATTTDAR